MLECHPYDTVQLSDRQTAPLKFTSFQCVICLAKPCADTIAEIEDRSERRPGLVVFGNLGMWLHSQPVITLKDTEDDQTYVTLGRIIDVRVDPALEDILSFPLDWIHVQPTHLTLKYSGSVYGSFSSLER